MTLAKEKRQPFMLDEQSEIHPFSVWTRQYEGELDVKYNFRLRDIETSEPLRFDKEITIANSEIIRRGGYTRRTDEISEKYRDVPGFCAMQLESEEELFDHIGAIYRLMHNHYACGKNTNFEFPKDQCCPSAQNIMEAGMLSGYPNASVVASEEHAYNAFPFFLNDKKGIIVADPTSDQLVDKPRNHIFVVRGGIWDYKVQWKRKSNLVPIEYINLDSIRERDRNAWYEYIENIETYFKKSFENLVRVHSKDNIEVLPKRNDCQ